jgi:hypothetical protein
MRAITLALAFFLSALPARANSAPKPFDVALALGYAFPIGSFEAGARSSDGTFGLVSLGLTGMYRLSRLFAAGISAGYGMGIPTLCADSSDCISSLGSDIIIAARGRVFLPKLLSAEPYADLGAGYEWFATTLADADASSTHSYNGPVFVLTEVASPFELGDVWTLGPSVGLSLGTFVHSHLEATGISRDLSVTDHTVHAWFTVGLRTSVRF